jgi:uncharacterized membrane protein YfcA
MGIENWLLDLDLDLDLVAITPAVLLVVLAGFTRGFSGFGSAMILAPGLSLLFNPQQVVATVILLEMTAGAGLLPEAVPQTRWQDLLPLILGAVVMVPVGAHFLALLEPLLIRRIIGLLILGFVLLLISGKTHYSQAHARLTWAVGGLSGFLTGLASMGGPPVVLYEMSGDRAAANHRANLIVFFASTQFVALVFYWAGGILTVTVLHLFAIFVPFFVLGLGLGRFYFKRVDEELFRRFVYGLLLVVGGLALVA